MTTTYAVSKIRNEIRFTREDGKYWYIDINTGEKHGFSDKVISRYPDGGKTCINNYIDCNRDIEANLLYLIVNGYDYNDIANVEKLYSAGANHLNTCHNYNIKMDIFAVFALKSIIKQALALESNIEDNETYSLRDIYDALEMQETTQKYKKYIDRCGMEYVFRMIEHYNYQGWDENVLPPEYMEMYLYYVCDSKINSLVPDWISKTVIADRAKTTIRYCLEMGVKPHKACIIDEYPVIKKNYEVWNNNKRDAVFAASQNSDWAFENDDYVAIVPTTIEELVKEGAALRNCLGDSWLCSYGNNDTHFSRGVVFVRSKNNPDKPLIACDFNKTNMNICQYFGKNNTCIQDKSALDFKESLQKHLYNYCQSVKKSIYALFFVVTKSKF